MRLLSALLLGTTLLCQTANAQITSKQEVLDKITQVNDYWQSNHKPQCRGFWDNAAYFTGNQAVYELTNKQQYLDYAME